MPYWTMDDLVARMGWENVVNTLDDDNDGVPDAVVITSIQKLSDGMTDAFAARSYAGTLPIAVDPQTGEVPLMIKAVSIQWARVFCFQRRPSYVQEYGETPFEEAMKISEAVASGQMFLPSSEGEGAPSVVGGIIFDHGPRILIPNADGTRNSGDFLPPCSPSP
jgi:phage gp36-like protein